MSEIFQFGTAETLHLDLPQGVLVANCDAPQGEPVEHLEAALREALEAPLDFPPLQLAIVPGDRIVIAVDSALPRAPTLVAAAVRWFLDHGAEADHLAVLAGGDVDTTPDPRSELPPELVEQVQLFRHDPAAEAQHCHLSNGADGHEIRIHRALFDADFVLPLGCLRPDNAWAYHGIHSGLFPEFSDAATQRRFHDIDQAPTPTARKHLKEEVNEIAWNLGVMFTVQVIPGGDGQILGILAGEPKAVQRDGAAQYAQAWRFFLRQRAELVIAAVTGGAEQQTWNDIARAVAAALKVVDERGSIAVCTSLRANPGPAIQRLSGAEDSEQALRRIRKQHSADAPAAAQLARALDNVKLYLLSELDEDTVEELGIAPIADAEDIARLARRAQSCILLGHAQHAIARVEKHPA